MLQKWMWWACLLVFGLLIGAVHSLSWWPRPAAPATAAPGASVAAQRHLHAQPHHWRALVLQQ